MIVAYYRVSTSEQARSGLGLEAQRAAVQAYADEVGERIAGEFTDVMSGGRSDRPEMRKALALARALNGTLVVARLDRLARNVAFIAGLIESSVDFRALDCPHATPLHLHILAAMAEYERRIISERIRAAFAAKKARGEVMPCPRKMLPEEQAMGTIAARLANRASARTYRAGLRPIAQAILAGEEGGPPRSLREAAAEMNRRGFRTRRRKEWTLSTLHVLVHQVAEWE